MGNYYVEILSVRIILYYLIKNTVLKNVIRSLDDGITTISFGNVLGQIYLSVTDIHAISVKGGFFTNIEGNLLNPQI
jgi:uncharacterized membrane protein